MIAHLGRSARFCQYMLNLKACIPSPTLKPAGIVLTFKLVQMIVGKQAIYVHSGYLLGQILYKYAVSKSFMKQLSV